MYCLLNWTSLDHCDLSPCYNEDGSVLLFETREEAEKEALGYNGFTKVVDLED